MPTQFVVLDFETANEDFASICQIGLAIFENQNYVDGWCVLVNPEDYFSGMNIHIHGITETQVASEPTFPDVYDRLCSIISGNILVSHTPFDQIALRQVCAKYGLKIPECKWLDSARVVRRCWPEQFAHSGYGLQNVAAFMALTTAHNALEDARCARGTSAKSNCTERCIS